jgi:hypothetical protein
LIPGGGHGFGCGGFLGGRRGGRGLGRACGWGRMGFWRRSEVPPTR